MFTMFCSSGKIILLHNEMQTVCIFLLVHFELMSLSPEEYIVDSLYNEYIRVYIIQATLSPWKEPLLRKHCL